MPESFAHKLDPVLAQHVATASRDDASLPLLLGLARPADARLLALLQSAGFELGSAAGDVLSGHASIDAVRRIAALAEVLTVESSRGLGPEGEPPLG